MNVTEYYFGARGRNRTGTVLPPRDFKSLASTNFATRAETCAWDSTESFTRSREKMEAEGGIEPPSTALQAAA